MGDYVMSVRAVSKGKFTADVGEVKLLDVPSGQDPSPADAVSPKAWYAAVEKAASWTNPENKELRGDVLFIVHGYNMSEAEVIERHRLVQEDLKDEGFKGVIVSFDWPSDDKAMAYLEDRHRAKRTAMKLVSEGIAYLSGKQTPTCTINVHLLGHSTGAYVIREAFHDADDTALPNPCWSVSQILFAAGDVSSASMTESDRGAESVYRHCVRLTNYSSRHDQALDLSNVKRVGTAPRVGRMGLPDDAPQKAVNVDCTQYYEQLLTQEIGTIDSPSGLKGMPSHSWYFGNKMFAKDLFNVIIGVDRMVVPTREIGPDGRLYLKHI